MTKIVLATNNPGKVRELNALLDGLGLEIIPQTAFAVPPVEETGLSFVENALLKARHAARYSGLPAVADDSGLAVDVLDGAPGIYSARYAGPDAADGDNVARLLSVLQGVPMAARRGRFCCVVVLLRQVTDPLPLICPGVWEGTITTAPRGDQGFGYDPVFLVPGLEQTAAELEPEIKNRLSHRGQALAQLRQELARHRE